MTAAPDVPAPDPRPAATRATIRIGTTIARPLILALAASLLTACASGQPDNTAGRVVARLGAVPIPPPAPPAIPLVATPGHPQLLVAGESARVILPGGCAIVALLGPAVQPAPRPSGSPSSGSPEAPPDTALATFTISLTPLNGAITVRANEFAGRDDHGRPLPLRALNTDQMSSNTARKTLVLASTIHDGAALLTWQPDGRALAAWTFNAELD